MEQGYGIVVTADNGTQFFDSIMNDYKSLPQMISQHYLIPESSFVLFYNGRCLSYYSRQGLNKLPLTGENDDRSIEIYLAAKLSHKPDMIHICEKEIKARWLHPVIVTSSFGVRIMQEFSLHEHTLVKHILKRIHKVYSIPIELQVLSYNGRTLKGSEFLADLFFEHGHFTTEVTLVLNFKDKTDENIELVNRKYSKALEHVTLQSLTGETLIDVGEECIWTVSNLKDFIKAKWRIPLKQQRLLQQGTVLNDYEMLFDRFLLENSNDTNNIKITLMVQPHCINVMFVSDYLVIPGDGYLKFPAMATIKEMKAGIAEVLCSYPERLALIPRTSMEDMNASDVKYDDDLMLDEIDQYSYPTLKVVRTVCVEIEGNQFDYLICEEYQTVEQMRKKLEISRGYKDKNMKLVFQNTLEKDTQLLDVPYQGTLQFEVIQNKSCLLM